jgi:hypothetical protein
MQIDRLLQLLGVEARARGAEWWAPCPCHEEKKASWSIRENGVHYCFGCGFGGSPADLVRQVFGFAALGSAVGWLQEHGFGEEQRQVVDAVVVVAPLRGRGAFKLPPGVVVAELEDWPTPIRRYAVSRGLTWAQVHRWRIGYAVSGRLAGRVVFPVQAEDGTVGGYQSRAYAGAQPPHLTPHSNEHPDGSLVWGMLHWPPPAQRKQGWVVVVEGALDAAACERCGARWVAAVGGSKPNPMQLARLAQFGRIVVATDGDQAGDDAAATLAALGRWSTVLRVPIPRGEDCRSLEKQDPGVLENLLRGTLACGQSERERVL